uniref:DUF2497 domain-containing protein n=2 Tax=Aureimonas frigidaquae TaxID=424757 RepID=A0A0P0Z4C5_9HYPH|nr:hypothetical protein [Aureimonas frigidaquae]
MEEILASIRQIIEQGDAERPVRTPPAPRGGAGRAAVATANPADHSVDTTPLQDDAAGGFVLRPSFEGSAALAFDDAAEVAAEAFPHGHEAGASAPQDAVSWGAEPDAQTWQPADVDAASWQADADEPFERPDAHDSFDLEAMLAAELASTLPDVAAVGMPAVAQVRAANSDDPRLGQLRDRYLRDAQEGEAPLRHAEPLISETSEAAIGASFAELTQAIRAGELRSLEEMAQDLLRPMMREWLEENLARMVEDIVREEIRRAVTRGR